MTGVSSTVDSSITGAKLHPLRCVVYMYFLYLCYHCRAMITEELGIIAHRLCVTECSQIPPHLMCHMCLYKRVTPFLILSVPFNLRITGRGFENSKEGLEDMGSMRVSSEERLEIIWSFSFLFKCCCSSQPKT